MACGKTTLGRALEGAGYADFIDLDEEIARTTGKTPAEWFATEGEAAFRAAELAELKRICRARPRAVIATGGGTPCNSEAMQLMLESGMVVWLEASIERTVERLLEADGQRPLVAGKSRRELAEFIPAHLAARVPFYSRAHLKFDSSRLDSEDEIAETVGEFIRRVGEKEL